MTSKELVAIYYGEISPTGEYFQAEKKGDTQRMQGIGNDLIAAAIADFERSKGAHIKTLDRAMQMIFGRKVHKPNSLGTCGDCIKRAIGRIRAEKAKREAAGLAIEIKAGKASVPIVEVPPLEHVIHTREAWCVEIVDGIGKIRPARIVGGLPSGEVLVRMLDDLGSNPIAWPKLMTFSNQEAAIKCATNGGSEQQQAESKPTTEEVKPVVAAQTQSEPPRRITQIKKGMVIDNGTTTATITRIATGIVYYKLDDSGEAGSISQSEIGKTWMISD